MAGRQIDDAAAAGSVETKPDLSALPFGNEDGAAAAASWHAIMGATSVSIPRRASASPTRSCFHAT